MAHFGQLNTYNIQNQISKKGFVIVIFLFRCIYKTTTVFLWQVI